MDYKRELQKLCPHCVIGYHADYRVIAGLSAFAYKGAYIESVDRFGRTTRRYAPTYKQLYSDVCYPPMSRYWKYD